MEAFDRGHLAAFLGTLETIDQHHRTSVDPDHPAGQQEFPDRAQYGQEAGDMVIAYRVNRRHNPRFVARKLFLNSIGRGEMVKALPVLRSLHLVPQILQAALPASTGSFFLAALSGVNE
jgi:hypothetical protein